VSPDLAAVAARFGAALRDAGLPVGPERCARFARAIALLDAASTATLYRCGLATLTWHPDHLAVYDRVFAAVFGTDLIPASDLDTVAGPGQVSQAAGEPADAPARDARYPGLATATETLATRDFADLTPAELAALAHLMRRLAIATPARRTRRYAPAPHGPRPDLRTTLRRARRTAGFPVMLARRRPRHKPRRLVVLCDISGSMEPYARAMLQLLYCAAGGRAAEVFSFATRLTRLTRLLATVPPAQMLAEAGRAAPDWSGGTRIGAALREFNHGYGLRGLARGAVVLVISDGWETGDPALVGREMARLSRVAYRIVWANPRTASPRYEPRVAGMAAAWPYCDAVVSAHSLAALDDLIAALGR
jgi:uncharacterized protein with von Willebrand factor type A (vWA) domain